MQFFKYEGLTLCETWSQENDNRRAIYEKSRKNALKSDSFNQKLQRKSYFFVADTSVDTITIVQEMENHRKDVIVIFAGYPDQMETFLQRNPGLRSRIAFHTDEFVTEIKAFFGIVKDVKIHYGHTAHYRCYLDTEWRPEL